MNFNSFTSFSYKKGLIKTLIDRIYKINNTTIGFDFDIKIMKTTLEKNEFPAKNIENGVRTYLENQSLTENVEMSNSNNTRYYKLPYIGHFSTYTKKKLNEIIKQFCKTDTKIQLIFTSFKLSSMFSTKDRISYVFKSLVVYKYICPSCNASYIGKTCRHLSTRINEHLTTDTKSNIFQHIKKSQSCKEGSNENCFTILDTASSKYVLKLKEGMHITWEKPTLNKQIKCILPTLCL